MHCPANLTVASCQSQAAINSQFATWLATIDTSGGTNRVVTITNPGPPLACGGSSTIAISVTSTCQDSATTCSATFTVSPAPSLTLTGATGITVASCQTQAAVNTAFATWLATASASGGCNAVFSNNNTGAPLACGGTTTVVFSVSSSCQTTQATSASFTVPAATIVTLTTPVNTTVASCQTQSAVNTAFALWLATARATGGYNAILTNSNIGAPLACGGSSTVIFTDSSTCQASQSASATFAVPLAPIVTITAPASVTVASCHLRTAFFYANAAKGYVRLNPPLARAPARD